MDFLLWNFRRLARGYSYTAMTWLQDWQMKKWSPGKGLFMVMLACLGHQRNPNLQLWNRVKSKLNANDAVSRSCRGWKFITHSHPRLQGGIVRSYVHDGRTLGNCKITIVDENKKTFLVEMRMTTVNTLLGSISKHLISRNLWTLCCSQFCTWSFFLARPATSGKTKIQEISRAVKSGFVFSISPWCFQSEFGHKCHKTHRNDWSIGTSWEQVLKTSSTPEIQQISCVPGCQRKISCRVAYRWQTRVTFRPFRLDCKFQGKNWSLTVDLVHCFWLR